MIVKNPTPRQISAFSAFYAAVILLIILLLSKFGDLLNASYLVILGITVAAFLAIYFIIIFYLKKYIYRKIKLIYKTIHRHKLSPEEKSTAVDINTDIIEDVEKEVHEWADSQDQQIKKLRTWQEYRRRFLGDISHELKTPIFNIQGYLETLLDGGLEDENINKRYLQRAAKNVDRLNTIIEDLESISRLESGKLMLDVHSFDIFELTKEVFEDLEIKATKNNIQLVFKPGANAHFQVNADRENIRQVMMNLMT
ncbi:MAG: two-component system phosphate regulon sensor histidine kinase PhoR, partial [Saprospiraceae bacterium]